MCDHGNKDAPTDSGKSRVSEDAMVTSDPTAKPVVGNIVAKENLTVISAPKRAAPPKAEQPSKRKAQNFLLMGAKKAKAARSARTAARVGCFEKSTKQNKLSNTGSGVPLSQVVRLKYVKGFTQAVSTPCRLEDLA